MLLRSQAFILLLLLFPMFKAFLSPAAVAGRTVCRSPASSILGSSRAFHRSATSLNLSPRDLFSYTPPPNHRAKIPRKVGQKTFALGDIHGDLPKLILALAAAGLIEPPVSGMSVSELKWAGGDSMLVQVGDILDRGITECSCLATLALLSQQAVKQGGGVVLLLGNHEVLNTLGLFNYAEKEGNEEFERIFSPYLTSISGGKSGVDETWKLDYAGNAPSRWRALEPQGYLTEISTLSNFLLGAQVGRSVFVHGGITAEHLSEFGDLEAMNAKATTWYNEGGYTPALSAADKNKQGAPAIIDCAQARARHIQKAMPAFLGGGTKDKPSPIWMRDFSSPPDLVPSNKQAERMIDAALGMVSDEAARIVVGHTPQRKINSACNAKVWRVDVGMSSGVSNNIPEILEIVHGETADELHVIRPTEGGGSERFTAEERAAYDPTKKDAMI
jgi:hypothetical protein